MYRLTGPFTSKRMKEIKMGRWKKEDQVDMIENYKTHHEDFGRMMIVKR